MELGLFLSGWCPVSRIGDIMAARSMNADLHKQQIPPLRCAPVGMTDYVDNVRHGTLERFAQRIIAVG
jgi:hypothetical protein